MMLDPALQDWKTKGDFYSVQPLNLSVFAIDLGNTQAAPKDTALMVHGFPESSYSFHKVVEGLRTRFARVVLVDLPGYGFSDKPEADYSYSLVAQADALMQVWMQMSVSGGHIICHDMGTSVTTEIVSRLAVSQLPAWFEDGVQSLTFTNGSMVLELATLTLMQKLLLNKKIGPTLSQLSSYKMFQGTIARAHGGTGDHDLSGEDVAQLWQFICLQNGHRKNHHLIRYLNDRRRYEKTRWLPSLALAAKRVPVHFCWGDADQVARVAMAHYLKKNICPNSTLTIMPNVGHFCQLGSPDVWLESVLSFYSTNNQTN